MDSDNNKMVYHIFPADVPFHVVGMLRTFITYFGDFSFFIIAGATEETRPLYEDVFKHFQFDRFQIIMINDKDREYPTLKRFLIKKKFVNRYDKELVSYMAELPKSTTFLLHALSSRWFNILLNIHGFKNVNWVCWGCWYYNKSKTLQAFLFNNIDRLNYSIYKNVICLMPQDIEDIKVQLKSKADFFYIPYPGNNKYLVEYALSNPGDRQAGISVLLGNNGYSIEKYDQFIRSLGNIGADYKITCMVSYGAEESRIESFRSAYSAFIEQGSLFLLTKMLSKEEYVIMLNSFDIYICPYDTQTGLAAIYLSLALGKKIYLQGSNYEYIKQFGAVISHTDEFKTDMDKKDFFLSEKEKEINKIIITNLLDKDSVISKWNSFFNHIL